MKEWVAHQYRIKWTAQGLKIYEDKKSGAQAAAIEAAAAEFRAEAARAKLTMDALAVVARHVPTLASPIAVTTTPEEPEGDELPELVEEPAQSYYKSAAAAVTASAVAAATDTAQAAAETAASAAAAAHTETARAAGATTERPVDASAIWVRTNPHIAALHRAATYDSVMAAKLSEAVHLASQDAETVRDLLSRIATVQSDYAAQLETKREHTTTCARRETHNFLVSIVGYKPYVETVEYPKRGARPARTEQIRKQHVDVFFAFHKAGFKPNARSFNVVQVTPVPYFSTP